MYDENLKAFFRINQKLIARKLPNRKTLIGARYNQCEYLSGNDSNFNIWDFRKYITKNKRRQKTTFMNNDYDNTFAASLSCLGCIIAISYRNEDNTTITPKTLV